MKEDPRKIVAVASAGGHWIQLQRLRPAWDDCHVTYITTKAGYETALKKDAARRKQLPPKVCVVMDANKWQKMRLVYQLLQIAWILFRTRPSVVISTGAAPGFFALKLGKLLGARTLWLDSVANVEELSLSGEKVKKSADLWLTQWPKLAEKDPSGKLKYLGNIL